MKIYYYALFTITLLVVPNNFAQEPGISWTKRFSADTLGTDEGFSVQQTSDSGYIITGSAGEINDSDVFLIKTNKDGDNQHTNTIRANLTHVTSPYKLKNI